FPPGSPAVAVVRAATDVDVRNPGNGHQPLLGRGHRNALGDRAARVHRAGRTPLWGNGHRIDAERHPDAAPAHTGAWAATVPRKCRAGEPSSPSTAEPPSPRGTQQA